MISELYEALVDAGASEKKAKEAAEVLSTENLSTKGDLIAVKEELAGRITELDQRLSGRITELDQRLGGRITALGEKLGGRITELDQRLGARISKLERDMAVVKWMIGATLTGIAVLVGGVASILIKLFSLA